MVGFGRFYKGCSSLNAAFILTMCILESKDNKEELILTTSDVQKAFVAVDHILCYESYIWMVSMEMIGSLSEIYTQIALQE